MDEQSYTISWKTATSKMGQKTAMESSGLEVRQYSDAKVQRIGMALRTA
jgi:hypothetical protein